MKYPRVFLHRPRAAQLRDVDWKRQACPKKNCARTILKAAEIAIITFALRLMLSSSECYCLKTGVVSSLLLRLSGISAICTALELEILGRFGVKKQRLNRHQPAFTFPRMREGKNTRGRETAPLGWNVQRQIYSLDVRLILIEQQGSRRFLEVGWKSLP